MKKLLSSGFQVCDELTVFNDGVCYCDTYMSWDQIDQIFVGAIDSLYKLVVIDNLVNITLKNIKHQFTIAYPVKGYLYASKEKQQKLVDIYSTIISKVFQRQWIQFVKQLASEEPVLFETLAITKDAFHFVKSNGNLNKINTMNISGCDFSDGYFYLSYSEPTKNKVTSKPMCLAGVTSNIHIIQHYVNKVSEFHNILDKYDNLELGKLYEP
jgi:hypothetical protein